MNRQKIQGFNYLEKDPSNGAIILEPQSSVEMIKLDNLTRRLKIVESQTTEILQLLRKLVSEE